MGGVAAGCPTRVGWGWPSAAVTSCIALTSLAIFSVSFHVSELGHVEGTGHRSTMASVPRKRNGLAELIVVGVCKGVDDVDECQRGEQQAILL